MADEFSVLTRARLNGRHADEAALEWAINIYEAERNPAGKHHQLAVLYPRRQNQTGSAPSLQYAGQLVRIDLSLGMAEFISNSAS